MSIAFFSGGHSTNRWRPDPATRMSSCDEIAVRDRLDAADVEHLSVAGVVGARPQERVSRIVDEDEVAELRSVAVDLDLAVLDGETDEPGDESLPVVLQQLARAVHVGQAQRAGADAEHVVVEQMVVLARGLVDAVDVGRPHEMRLGHGQAVGLAVHLPRAREHDLHRRVVVAARLEDRQLRPAVDLEIGVRDPACCRCG